LIQHIEVAARIKFPFLIERERLTVREIEIVARDWFSNKYLVYCEIREIPQHKLNNKINHKNVNMKLIKIKKLKKL
jgi:hypothetical protein